jgi:hypothetical protein
LNPGAKRSAVSFRANEFDLEPVATMAGVLEERVRRLVAGRRPAKFNEEVEIAIAVVVQESGAQTSEGAAHAGLLGDVGESPVVIAPERVTAMASDVGVRIAVTVIVSHGDLGQRKRKAVRPWPSLFCDLTGMFFSLLRLLKRAGLYVSAPAEL